LVAQRDRGPSPKLQPSTNINLSKNRRIPLKTTKEGKRESSEN
jgi:hypothetical protein